MWRGSWLSWETMCVCVCVCICMFVSIDLINTQITTSEVSIARVYNHEVRLRQQAKELRGQVNSHVLQ